MRILLLLFYLFCFTSLISQNIVTWDGGAGTNNWEDPLNWDVNQIPGNDARVIIDSGDSVSISAGVIILREIFLSNSSVLETGTNAFVFLNWTQQNTTIQDRLVISDASKFINRGLVSTSGAGRGIRIESFQDNVHPIIENYGDLIVSAIGSQSLQTRLAKITNYDLINFNKTPSNFKTEIVNHGIIESSGNSFGINNYIGEEGSILRFTSAAAGTFMGIDSFYGNSTLGNVDNFMQLRIDYISPGFSPGVLDVVGSTLLVESIDIEIGADTMDQIIVDGDFIVQSADRILNVSLLDGYIPSVNDTFCFVQVTGGVYNQFNEVNLPPEMSDFILDYSSPGELRLILNPALPVELVSFIGSSDKEGNKLKWKTATELNSAGFDVEVLSSSTNKWEKLGFVTGNSNSVTEKEYSYLDRNPGAGINYYRLKQIDLDGSWEYSDRISIRSSNQLNKIYPTVFTDQLTIDVTTESNFILLDQSGKIVLSRQLKSGIQVITMDEISSGVYYSMIGEEVSKLIKL